MDLLGTDKVYLEIFSKTALLVTTLMDGQQKVLKFICL
jgi:hypothetical protein